MIRCRSRPKTIKQIFHEIAATEDFDSASGTTETSPSASGRQGTLCILFGLMLGRGFIVYR